METPLAWPERVDLFSVSPAFLWPVRTVMLWRVSRPIRTRSKPVGFILPCQPALADKPPSGPGWLHEIKFAGYRVIARKDGEQVRLWARTTSDYSSAFTRIRDAAAALPVR